MLNRAALVAPDADGGVLIEPSVSVLPLLADRSENAFRDARVTLLGRGLHDVRVETRTRLSINLAGPAWVLGHQPEFMHAGVWFKHVIADRLARRTGGFAVNLVVDNDEPKSTGLRTVRLQGDEPLVADVAVPTARPRRPFEQWPAMNAGEIAAFGDAVRAGVGEAFDASMMPAVLAGFTEAGDAGGFVGQMIAGRRQIDTVAGVKLIERRVSDVWGGPLLGQMLVDAERFAATYNAAVAGYRRTHRIKGTMRPVPDLARDGDRIELPIWTYRPGEPRQRLFVERGDDAIAIFADAEPVATLTREEIVQWCENAAVPIPGTVYAVRPRALSLTLWARLTLGDVFIHGIGGAKYDEMTDELMRRYFGIMPPPMVCTSATLRLPIASAAGSPDDVREAARRLRELTYNPQRVASEPGSLAPLLAERSSLIERSGRLRESFPTHHEARRDVFGAIRSLNARMRDRMSVFEAGVRDQLSTAAASARHARVLGSREYFVGLFPRERIAALAAAGDAILGA